MIPPMTPEMAFINSRNLGYASASALENRAISWVVFAVSRQIVS